MASADLSYRITIHYLWASGEVAAGGIISCLHILPRLIRTCMFRVRSTFSSDVKLGEKTPAPGMRQKRRAEEPNNWYELRTEISDQYPSPNEHGPKQTESDGSKDDSGQASLMPYPSPVLYGEHLPGQILMTTRVETRTEERHIADRALREDLERQQLR